MTDPKPVTELPSSVTTVDMQTGKTIKTEPVAWKILPPPKHCCQICGHQHKREEPHNAQTMYYKVVFGQMIGRMPTWADALAHCDDRTKQLWEKALRDGGHWSEPPNGEAPIADHGV